MSSVRSSEQCNRKLCITDKAPALPSRVTCQVKASPRAFSDSISLPERGNEFRHNNSMRGKSPLTTGTPAEYDRIDLKIRSGSDVVYAVDITQRHYGSNQQPSGLCPIQ